MQKQIPDEHATCFLAIMSQHAYMIVSRLDGQERERINQAVASLCFRETDAPTHKPSGTLDHGDLFFHFDPRHHHIIAHLHGAADC